MTNTRPTFQMSADARLLYQAFMRVAVGATITFDELEDAVSRPRDQIRGAIHTALRHALRNDGAVFANVRGVGYQRCTDVNIVDSAAHDTKHIRRAARRSVERLTKVADFASLPPAKQMAHTASLSIMSAVASMTTESAVKRVSEAAHGRASELPISETLKAFLK